MKTPLSKNQVRKAVKKLVENKLSLEDKLNYLAMLADFRSSHHYPMQSMINYFRKKAFAVDRTAIIVRRLKRIPSIINKLKRFPEMQISTMGDIGGIRIITKNLRQVQSINKGITNGRTHNKLLFEKDYLTHPKDSGYRGIHLVYSYQGAKELYHNFRVELQIRSSIQHAWATAVEVVGTFLGQELKADKGEKPWLEFFQLVSKAFAATEENRTIEKPLKKNLQFKIKELNVFELLLSFTVAIRQSSKKSGWYLLKLDIEERKVSLTHYEPSLLSDVVENYRRLEQEISENKTQDAVLVSAESMSKLKKAYPNYFADTHVFLARLQEVIQ